MLDSFKCFVSEKTAFLLTSTQILVFQGIIFKACCMSTKVKSHSITGFQNMGIDKKKIILLNLGSISHL